MARELDKQETHSLGKMSEDYGLSFWKLDEARRCELVWEHVMKGLGAFRYTTKSKATSATIIAPALQYEYDVTIKSYGYVLKNFSRCNPFHYAGDADKYTVVFTTVRPPVIKPGYLVYTYTPPTMVRAHETSTSFATVAKTHYVADVRLACFSPLRIASIIRYREPYNGLLYNPLE